ncbi:MAG: hypothetical protein PHX08_06355 [Lachnospiraceae bacterium]|nr:hypothetical protein [Lachnospiraceae bacterium]
MTVFILFTDAENSKHKLLKGIIGGAIIARAITGTPLVIVACILCALFLVIKRQFEILEGYIIGGIVQAIIVITYCTSKGGFNQIINGIHNILKEGSYFKIEKTWVFIDNFKYILFFMTPFFICLLFVLIARCLVKKDELFKKIVIVLTNLFFIVGVIKGFSSVSGWISYGWFEIIIYIIFLQRNENNIYRKIIFPFFYCI